MPHKSNTESGNDIKTNEKSQKKQHELAAERRSRSRTPPAGWDSYFDSMGKFQEAVSKRNYDSASKFVRENLLFIPVLVQEKDRLHGLPPSIPALEQGGTILALVGDDEGLSQMRKLVASTPELSGRIDTIEQHFNDRQLFEAILKVVEEHPNCLQTDVKKLIGAINGRRMGILISYLEKYGKLVRVRVGRTHKLALTGSATVQSTLPKRVVKSHRTNQSSPRLVELDLSSLSYVPLPRAPHRWDEKQTGREEFRLPEKPAQFGVRDANWQIVSTTKIPPESRPDPAFRMMHSFDSGVLMIDDLGNAEGLDQFEAAALRYDRNGNLAVKTGLQHSIYRIGVHPIGSDFVAMSRDCVVHAYDENLETIFETTLVGNPEISKLRKRFEIPEDKLKNHVRCVALSKNAGRYLFTAVDEAWCVDVFGKGLWGIKVPIQEGWTRVATQSNKIGTSTEVDDAAAILGLKMPFSPEDIKRNYRDLARQCHPDLFPADSAAGEKMKSLNSAADLLVGFEENGRSHSSGDRFVRESEATEIMVGGVQISISMGGSEYHAADWIYAASFAGNSDSVYLATYSGRVILVDESGKGIRAYDIGAVPRRIVDTGKFLYLLTDTRLYVLQDNELHALIDVFDGGDLVVAQEGFGLLEKRRFRWFQANGHYAGSVVTKDPIRRVYSTVDEMIIETRVRKAVIHGAPDWWLCPMA